MSRHGRRPRQLGRHGTRTAVPERLQFTPPLDGHSAGIPNRPLRTDIAARTAAILFRLDAAMPTDAEEAEAIEAEVKASSATT